MERGGGREEEGRGSTPTTPALPQAPPTTCIASGPTYLHCIMPHTYYTCIASGPTPTTPALPQAPHLLRLHCIMPHTYYTCIRSCPTPTTPALPHAPHLLHLHCLRPHTYYTCSVISGEFCRRPCVKDDHRICQFNFDIHLYQTMSRACYDCPRNSTDCERPECVAADGVRRMVVAANKAIPGPPIEVCVGDKVLVDVMNNLPSTAMTLHWHGLTMGASFSMPTARSTPYMDGTPGVTQCPISPGSGFRYAFFASNPGTHFWHAQTGLERGDGLFGPLIVHQPTEVDPNQFLAEHLLMVNDWYHKSTQVQYANRYSGAGIVKPDAILINGKGPQQHEEDAATPRVPYARFLVENGTRYRLRMINAAITNCPVTVTVDSHDLIILSADGGRVSPVNASSILLHPGERYDAMFTAEQDPDKAGGTYWVRVTGGGECTGLHQYAALQYLPSNYTLFQPLPEIPSTPVSIPEPGTVWTPQINHLTFRAPPKPLLVNRRPLKSENCSGEGVRHGQCNADYCECIHNLNIPMGSIVDLVLIGEGGSLTEVGHWRGPANGTSYPVHLHGYKFWVLSQVEASQVPNTTNPLPVLTENSTLITADLDDTWVNPNLSREKMMQLDREGKLVRDLESPVMKDSVAIPPGGYTISQVVADALVGASLVLQVGGRNDVPKSPPPDFPTC
ncbi:Laccase-1-like 1 [Homarus americanus]|uniref:Laccase-1-like 1 n=1 Tax=Homarus americanus TaxID=6706 RepID=A0A8J5K0C6_HOMAM|nr:Laccase-1-like 1 [Homarus americanus]